MEVMYFDDGDVAAVDGHLFRRDKRTGYYLSSKPIGNRRKRLHVYMWERDHGDIPEGYHVHHKDHDKRNNEPSNLEILTRSEHLSLHGNNMSAEHLEKLRKHCERIRPLTKAWHSSEEGKEWHRKHAKKSWEEKNEIEYTCTHCGKSFMTKNSYSEKSNRFCSNNCKSAFRRASGVDNVERKCALCGKAITVNKYSKITRCKECARIRIKKL